QPFNRLSLSPAYKWLTAHIGHSSMTFSPYTLGGHSFFGLGVEARPSSQWEAAAMFGELRKAVEYTKEGRTPVYQRLGGGAKAKYTHKKGYAGFSFFRSKDRRKSLSAVPDSLGVYPEENLALHLEASQRFFDKISLTGEIGASALTRDYRQPREKSRGGYSFFNWMFPAAQSTEFFKAFKVGTQYSGERFSAGLEYERIDPGYHTHGSYYSNNDLERMYLTGATSLWNIQIAVSAGVERDDLAKQKASNMDRKVGSLSLSYGQKTWGLNAAYSNFSTVTNVKPYLKELEEIGPYENPDTLNYVQTVNNMNLGGFWALSSTKTRAQSLNWTAAYNRTSDDSYQGNQLSGVFNGTVSHSISWKELQLNVAVNGNFNYQHSPGIYNSTYGAGTRIGKMFWNKKLSSSVGINGNMVCPNVGKKSSIFTVSATGGYKLKSHSVNLRAAYMKRDSGSGKVRDIQELNFSCVYNYTFSSK
ncbi:MAG: hypothetical protein MI784_15500, partial [Cytophagales bacterium]|nr:hypothetical protein [Cytophagales bacterium]